MNDNLRRGGSQLVREVAIKQRVPPEKEREPEIKGHGERCGFMFSVTSGRTSDVGRAQSVRFCTFQFQGWEKHRLFVD